MKFLIDVRNCEEFDERHLPNAQNLPVDEILMGNIDFLENCPKDSCIELYCRSGGRSEKARLALEHMGFTQIKNLGGIDAVEKMLSFQPKKYWFRPARFWKWFAFYYPASQRGWAVTLILLGIGGLVFAWIESGSDSRMETVVSFLPWGIALMAVFDMLCFRHGEYPSWWRKRDDRIDKQ